MSFHIHKKTKSGIYVYEATGYWDSEKKQTRHKRVYLGKLDEKTGSIIPKKKHSISTSSKSYGQFYLIKAIA